MTGDDEPTPTELLLAQALEQLETATLRGEEPDLEAFCASYPTIREPLQRMLGLGRQLAALGRGAAPIVPEKLGPYRILGELGRGGMAPVYRARDDRLDRDVALKVLPPETADRQARQERFLREARILARVSHPHVVSIYDVGQDGPWCYLAMELLPGSLQDQLWGEGPLPSARQTARWVLQAAEGLRHAHEMGVLHRDVKPANLLLDAQGQVRVADFGLAALDGAARLTGSRQGLGTPGFAAPEQARGEPGDLRCDVYGLGATLRALLGPGTLPPGLMSVVDRATAADPARRHPDMPAFAAHLRSWLDGRLPAGWRVAAAGIALAGLVAVLDGTRQSPPVALEPPQGIRVSVSSEPVSMAQDSAAERGARLWQELRPKLLQLRASSCGNAPGGRGPGLPGLLLDPLRAARGILCEQPGPTSEKRP